MDVQELKKAINSELKGVVLEARYFGRSTIPCVWVEVSSLEEVIRLIKKKYDLNWLENLSAIHMDEAVVISYFFRGGSRQIVVRGTLSEKMKAPSIQKIFPMAIPFEREIADLMGVQFEGADPLKDIVGERVYLPDEWKGFPLLKTFHVPVETE